MAGVSGAGTRFASGPQYGRMTTLCLAPMETEQLPPLLQIHQRMITAYWTSQALHAAATLGIADALRDGPLNADELGTATGTHGPTVFRLVRALAGLGLFLADGDGRLGLTPLGEYLRSDHPQSIRAWAIALNEPWFHRAWEGLTDAVRTGEVAFDRAHGMGFWAYCAAHPDAGALFDAGMTSGSAALARALTQTCDMAGMQTVVDVGGGQGRLLVEVLLNQPHLRGILFDQPQVVSGAERILREAGVLDRCQIVGGSISEEIPGGGDAYILSRILHDWNDADAAIILRSCQRAMAPDARLLLIEQVVPPGNGDAWSKLSDLNMLVLFGGRERTEAEFRQLLASTGFRLAAVHPTPTSWTVVEAVRV